jgi:hypothetical protein
MENRDAARTALRTSLLEADGSQRVRAGIVLQTPIPGNLGIQFGSICYEAKQWSIVVSLSMH